MEIDRATLRELRDLEPRAAYDTIRRAVYQSPGGASSEDFQSALDQLVRDGILSWEEIEQFEQD
jgi:hypothetical protein